MSFLDEFREAFAAIPEQQRRVWTCRCLGNSDAQISRQLCISERNVNVSAQRGAKKCLPDHDGSARTRLMCYLLGKVDG